MNNRKLHAIKKRMAIFAGIVLLAFIIGIVGNSDVETQKAEAAAFIH